MNKLSFHSSLYCFQHCEEIRAYEHSGILCLVGVWILLDCCWRPSASGRFSSSILVRTLVWMCVFPLSFFGGWCRLGRKYILLPPVLNIRENLIIFYQIHQFLLTQLSLIFKNEESIMNAKKECRFMILSNLLRRDVRQQFKNEIFTTLEFLLSLSKVSRE